MRSIKKERHKKHRGNPHGNAPRRGIGEQSTVSDDNLRQSVKPGVSQSGRLKQ